jgi:hypothetical protein
LIILSIRLIFQFNLQPLSVLLIQATYTRLSEYLRLYIVTYSFSSQSKFISAREPSSISAPNKILSSGNQYLPERETTKN